MNYDSIWTAKAQPITDPEEERALIAQAQAGDQDATLRLFTAYLPVLTRAVTRYAPAMEHSDTAHDDARSVAWLALMETIQGHDLERDRLALTIKFRLAERFKEAAGGHIPVHIPDRMRHRYFSLMEKADGDVDTALGMAREHGMSPEVFRAVYEAVNRTVWFHGVVPTSEDEDTFGEDTLVAPEFGTEQVDADNAMMVAQAFAAIDHADDWRHIVRLYYGFTARDHAGLVDVDTQAEYDAAVGSDSNTAKATFSTRPTVQRKRTQALAVMRESLGAEHTDHPTPI